jgi:hypothetical protein
MTARSVPIAILIVLLCAACGSSSPPSGPSNPPTVTAVSVSGVAASPTVGDTAQLSATAAFSDGSSQSVTSQATWETNNASVATVSAAGLATFLAAGNAELKATYRGMSGTARVAVTPKTAPRFQITGTINEKGTTKPVNAVNVAIIDGPDAGRSTVTDNAGVYTVTNVTTGSFNLRATRNGYESLTIPVALNSDMRLDFALALMLDVSPFLGTYNAALTIAQQSCEFPFTVGPNGTINLDARSDGSNLTVTIVERGTTRTYRGTLRTDGTFSGGGGGVIAGITITPGEQKHDYTGDVTGTVSGRSISATENVLFGAPCPGRTMKITYAGSR